MNVVSWCCLLGGGVAFAFGQGHFPNALLLILGVALFAQAFRSSRYRWVVPGSILVLVGAWEIAYAGMIPMPTFARFGMEIGISLLLAGVFATHARVARQSRAFVTTLVLPCGFVAFDMLSARLSPGASWGSLAYSLVEPLTFGQIASLVGWTGLTFAIVWSGAVLQWVVELRDGRVVRGLMAYVGVVVALGAYGFVRTSGDPDPVGLSVACVVAPSTFDDDNLERVWRYTRGYQQSESENELARARIAASMDEHFAAVEAAIDGGAQIVVWAEVNPTMTAAEEPAWIDRGRALARESGIWIGLAMSVFRPATQEPTKNELVMIRPDGEIAFTYLKATRVPGSSHAVGDGVLPRATIGDVTLSAAICFDLDFPQLIAQCAGEVDVLCAPSNDWEEAAPSHARMARMRAIEQGVVLVRPTKDGVSLVTDSVGRVLAVQALGDRDVGTLIANIPVAGTWTLYGVIGDLFSWACCGGGVLLALGIRRERADVAGPSKGFEAVVAAGR